MTRAADLRGHQVLGVVVLRHDSFHHGHQTPEGIFFTLKDQQSDGGQPDAQEMSQVT